MDEKLRLVAQAFVMISNTSREKQIEEGVAEKKENEITKKCPNAQCGFRFPKNLRKCTKCGTWYEKYKSSMETDVMTNEIDLIPTWTPEKYYSHVESDFLPSVTCQVLDPFLENPNSKINIYALLKKIKESANIDSEVKLKELNDGYTRENARQWTFVCCDALIALQV